MAMIRAQQLFFPRRLKVSTKSICVCGQWRPDDVWAKYTTVTYAQPRWDAVLDEYGVEYLILDANLHGRSGLLQEVSQSPRWQQAFTSRSAVLFVRKSRDVAQR